MNLVVPLKLLFYQVAQVAKEGGKEEKRERGKEGKMERGKDGKRERGKDERRKGGKEERSGKKRSREGAKKGSREVSFSLYFQNFYLQSFQLHFNFYSNKIVNVIVTSNPVFLTPPVGHRRFLLSNYKITNENHCLNYFFLDKKNECKRK